MNLRNVLLNEILPAVTKPSRYLGNELHSVHKDPASVDLRMALCFPDLYELGLGNLGLHILYAILNRMEGVWAERVYTPAPDLEAELRARGLPLFLHESKDPLGAADAVGFSLQSELTYVNVLNALDLAGIPVRSEARTAAHPLIFAGGPTTSNPEPMAPFIDFFLIGDGEEAIVEIAEALRRLKHASRREQLEAIAQISGIYVPALYPTETLPDGRVLPRADAPKIVRRMVRDLDQALFPEGYLTPFMQLVHDGIGIEVLRGCTQGCRFCHAGMVSRPVRERNADEVERLVERTIASTGIEGVALVSLSTCDHSRARALVGRASQLAHAAHTSVSLPSLRLDSFSVELAEMVSGVRRSGLTFAPEAGTARLRAVINKNVSDEDLIELAVEAFRRGWPHVKTYFMIGLPTETDEDVLAIADLCVRTLRAGRAVDQRAAVRTGVSAFVPKPGTPFQWARQIGLEETIRKHELLAGAFKKHPAIKFGRHEPAASFIEGLLARADRRAADLIEAAWRHGAGLETWSERLNLGAWLEAIEEVGYDVAGQLGERSLDERLPWDHIDTLVSRAWLKDEWARSQQMETLSDCRQGRCNRCGVSERVPELCAAMLDAHRQARAEGPDAGAKAPDIAEEPIPPPKQRMRLRIGREGEARLLSHLELQSVWIRALRRADAPLAYTQGFHAHPRMNFSTAAPLGEESRADYLDVLLTEDCDPSALAQRLRATLPIGFLLLDARPVPLNTPSLMSSVVGFRYSFHIQAEAEEVRRHIEALLEQPEIPVGRSVKAGQSVRGRKGGPRKKNIAIDLRPLICELAVAGVEEGGVKVSFTTRLHENRLAKPKEILELLEVPPGSVRVVKEETFLTEDASASPSGGEFCDEIENDADNVRGDSE